MRIEVRVVMAGSPSMPAICVFTESIDSVSALSAVGECAVTVIDGRVPRSTIALPLAECACVLCPRTREAASATSPRKSGIEGRGTAVIRARSSSSGHRELPGGGSRRHTTRNVVSSAGGCWIRLLASFVPSVGS